MGEQKSTHKTIEENFPIYEPLAWKTNFASQGLFFMPYIGPK
jgi:hypothetical protein